MYYIDCDDCAPYMLGYTEEEAMKLEVFFGKDYIIDPMSHDQCLAYIWRTLSKFQQNFFNVIVVKNKKDMFKCYYNIS